jgi:hypothetical protein
MHRTTFAILALASLGSSSDANDATQTAEPKVVRFDYEDGDPQGWEVVDGFLDPDAGTKGFIRRRQNTKEELGQYSLATERRITNCIEPSSPQLSSQGSSVFVIFTQSGFRPQVVYDGSATCSSIGS